MEPASPSAYVSASLSLSLTVLPIINKIKKKKKNHAATESANTWQLNSATIQSNELHIQLNHLKYM